MARLIVTIMALFIFSPVMSAEISENLVEEQQNDQQRCEQIRLKACLDKCKTTDVDDCEQLCTETSKNECLSAGE